MQTRPIRHPSKGTIGFHSEQENLFALGHKRKKFSLKSICVRVKQWGEEQEG